MIENKKKTVAIFGAGISGLTVAHEFSKRGHLVKVFESNSEAGGFFRSARRKKDNNMPSEYSWHGMGPWYHNVYSLLKEIPFDNESSLYDQILSRPIDFGLAGNSGRIEFDDLKGLSVDVKKMFRLTTKDTWLWYWIMFKAWCSNKRSYQHYSTLNAKKVWGNFLSPLGINTWSSTFGPWVGSDWCNVSFHQVAKFFKAQLTSKPSHFHKADEEGGPWEHKARSGWLLLKGPSSEMWFDKWVSYLKKLNVEFNWDEELIKLDFDGVNIQSATTATNKKVEADIYVMAINPFFLANIIDRTKALAKLPELNLFRGLVQDGPHVQVSFRIGFSEQIKWPRKRCGLVIEDSAFNLTLFSEEQVWNKSVFLGKNIKSLWTVTACVSKIPGPVHKTPLNNCTKEQFIDEVMFQLKECSGLDKLIKEANNGKSWTEYRIEEVEVWHEWVFSPEGISSPQPKWVNTTNTQKYMPSQKTTIPNLVLAGAHTKTSVDVWSIEAAVESGKLAAKVYEPEVEVIGQHNPVFFRVISRIDDLLFSLMLPNVLDLMLVIIFLGSLILLYHLL